MYSQRYIDRYNEKHLFDILRGKYPGKIDANKKGFDDIFLYYTFQHFLVKCYTNGIYRKECVPFLLKMYDDILNRPYAYVDSPLLKNNVLDAIIGNNQHKDKIKLERDKYFDGNIAMQLYTKSKSQELTDEEKNQLYSFLLLHITSKDNRCIKIMEDAVRDIINSNKKTAEMNDIELKFYCQYISNYALENRNIKTVNMIGIEKGTSGGRESSDLIAINKNGYGQDISILTKIICHETRHSIQEHESIQSNSKTAFEYAQFFYLINI